MSFDCIISQGHIPEFDPQGSLTWQEKLDAFEFSLKHLRQNNPNSYIILTGHGKRPINTKLCNYVYWEDVCRPIDENGWVINMPAQFFFVSMGIEHAISKGFTKCLKTRTDCVIGRENITKWCEDQLSLENKNILLTQQTGVGFIGDCFMYGDINLLFGIWNKNNPVLHRDGLVNTYLHMSNFLKKEMNKENLKQIASFRDVVEIPFSCLRWNYHKLKKIGLEKILEKDFNYNDYSWGRANGWHIFDKEGNVIVNRINTWTKKDFYS